MRYFATTAKIMNVWRDSFALIAKAWGAKYPSTAADSRAVPPRCLSGRWGAIDGCEARLLKCTPDHIHGAFASVFCKPMPQLKGHRFL